MSTSVKKRVFACVCIPPCVPRCTCILLCLCSVRGHLPDRSSHLHIPVSHPHPHPHPKDAELMDFAAASLWEFKFKSSPWEGSALPIYAALSQVFDENLEPF